MIEWWAMNWDKVIGVVGTVMGVIGLYVGFKGWKRKKPTYVIRSNNIFSGLEHTIPDVEVRFPDYGAPVKALTVTKVAFWNAGTETINNQDIVKDNPLSLRAKSGVIILSASVIERTTPFNKLECALNTERTEATITFDYLDRDEGALIQLFHSGTGNDDIQFEGTIRGAQPIRRRPFETPRTQKKVRPSWRVRRIQAACMFWVAVAMGGYWITLYGIIPMGVVTFGVLVLGVYTTYKLYVTSVPYPLSKIYWDDH